MGQKPPSRRERSGPGMPDPESDPKGRDWGSPTLPVSLRTAGSSSASRPPSRARRTKQYPGRSGLGCTPGESLQASRRRISRSCGPVRGVSPFSLPGGDSRAHENRHHESDFPDPSQDLSARANASKNFSRPDGFEIFPKAPMHSRSFLFSSLTGFLL